MPQKINKHTEDFFASCPTGTEPILEKEIVACGAKNTVQQKGGVLFQAQGHQALELILSSRVASKVYKKLYSFFIKTEKDLYFEAKNIKWKSLMDLDQTFKIETIQGKSPNGLKRSHFKNSMHLNLVLKDAIVDWFRENQGERPNVSPHDADLNLLQFIAPTDNPHASKEEVSILLDLAGNSLGERGYRQAGESEAPVRENLAAGILLSMKEDIKELPFIDTMCGSGTFLLEAAMIKADIPPTLDKLLDRKEGNATEQWAFERHHFYSKDKDLQKKFQELVDAYYLKCTNGLERLLEMPVQIFGVEQSGKTLSLARKYCRRSRMQKAINFEQNDALRTFPKTQEKSIVFCNPPYGERLGEEEELESLYYEYGEHLKNNFKGHVAYIFTGNMNLAKKVSLRTSSRLIFYNGNIECRLLEYRLY